MKEVLHVYTNSIGSDAFMLIKASKNLQPDEKLE